MQRHGINGTADLLSSDQFLREPGRKQSSSRSKETVALKDQGGGTKIDHQERCTGGGTNGSLGDHTEYSECNERDRFDAQMRCPR